MTAKRRSLADSLDVRSGHEGPRPVVGVDVGKTAERSTPIKVGVKLAPTVYRRLKRWLADQSGTFGGPVDANKIGAALFAEMLADEELAARVLARARGARA